MSRTFNIITCFVTLLICSVITSCYGDATNSEDAAIDSTFVEVFTQEQRDSITFFSTRHYTEGYNFVVYDDSISLLLQQPEELVSQLEIDTFAVAKEHQLVVGDIRIIPQDSIDSVWVQVATDEGRFGWIHERELLEKVVPVDPISQFIMFFSDTHIIISLIILTLLGIAYAFRYTYKHKTPFVHLRDIPTFYPTLLCLIVATSATFYASLQMFAAETWQHFYYNPSLNPLQMPFNLGIFISSVWAMLIVSIATIDEVRHHLHAMDLLLYLCGLVGMCGALYIVFSISTLYYIGYVLLVLYYYYALKKYFTNRNRFICGNCGSHMRDKGVCPYCGAENE